MPEFKVEGFTLTEQVPALCYFCHEENNKTNIHYPVQEGECSSCHSTHSSNNKYLLTDSITSNLCITCHELEIPNLVPKLKVKRKVKVLYINADEDHVSRQFNEKKGDLKINEYGRKINTIEPRLACVFEGIEKESKNSKRNKLINKHYFSGVYKKCEDIWEDVLEYIRSQAGKTFDPQVVEKFLRMLNSMQS